MSRFQDGDFKTYNRFLILSTLILTSLWQVDVFYSRAAAHARQGVGLLLLSYSHSPPTSQPSSVTNNWTLLLSLERTDTADIIILLSIPISLMSVSSLRLLWYNLHGIYCGLIFCWLYEQIVVQYHKLF